MPFTSPKAKVLAVLFLNKYGAKFYSKFYTKHSQTDFSKNDHDIRTEEGQEKLQKSIFSKIKKMNVARGTSPDKTEIFSFSGYVILFKIIDQLLVLLLCEEEENYVLMQSAIDCIGSVLLSLTNETFTQKVVQDNLDSLVITVDEVIDEGIIINLDELVVQERVRMREGTETKSSTKLSTNQEQSSAFSSLFGFAKNSLQKTLNFG